MVVTRGRTQEKPQTQAVLAPPRRKRAVASLATRLKRMYYDPHDPAGFASIRKLAARLPRTERAGVLPWLRSQDVYTTFHPRRRNFDVNFYLAPQANRCWELDLAIFDKFAEENDGFKYLLCVIDVFDRFLWVEPMRSKTAEDALAAFKAVLGRAGGRKPVFIRSDAGTEFANHLLKKYLKGQGITWQLAGNWAKAGHIERVIRTLKDKLYKIFYYRGSFRYVDILQDVVAAYNASVHSRTGLAPAEVGGEDAYYIWSRHYRQHVAGPPPAPRLHVGDHVRALIKRKGALADRGFKQGFTDEIFRIYRVQLKHQTGYLAQPLYHLKDLAGEPIIGGWVTDELTPVNYDPNADFRIHVILDTRIDKRTGRKQYFVSFWGYPKSFNDWVDARGVKRL